MIRLAISPAAYRAIAATLASSVGVAPQRAPNGDYFIWLDRAVVNRLAAMRGHHEQVDAVQAMLRGAASIDVAAVVAAAEELAE